MLYSSPHTDVNYAEIAGGNLAQVNALLLYGAQYGLGSGTAVAPHINGNAGFDFGFVSHAQNSSPPSRAASASALTRPWNR